VEREAASDKGARCDVSVKIQVNPC